MVRPIRDCAIPDCGPKPIAGRGLCSKHYYHAHRYGDPLRQRPVIPPICTVEGCEKASRGAGMCSTHYSRVRLHGDPHARPRFYASGACEAPDCGKEAKRARYCSKHRARMERYGSLDLPVRADRHQHTQGYVVVKSIGHPAAQKNGWAMEHRIVLFDAIGAGEHPCRWCGRPVRWTTGKLAADSLVVDHLDDNKTNNELSNLAPACITCNSGRSTHWGRDWRSVA